MNIILCGFKCAGKTTVGLELSKCYEQRFIDTDELMLLQYNSAHNTQLSIGGLYKRLGEKQFRKLEREIVIDITDVKNSVIALGGGTILDMQNVKLLRQLGVIVFLNMPPEVLWDRLCKAELPAYFPKTHQQEYFKRIYEEREKTYKEIAQYTINDLNINTMLSFIGDIYGDK